MKKSRGKKKDESVVLSEEDRLEYARRNALVIQKRQEYEACAVYLQMWQDDIILRYDLPQKFDINLNSGVVTVRPQLEGENAENGRV